MYGTAIIGVAMPMHSLARSLSRPIMARPVNGRPSSPASRPPRNSGGEESELACPHGGSRNRGRLADHALG